MTVATNFKDSALKVELLPLKNRKLTNTDAIVRRANSLSSNANSRMTMRKRNKNIFKTRKLEKL